MIDVIVGLGLVLGFGIIASVVWVILKNKPK